MDMALRVQQHVVGLEIAMDDTLRVDVLQSTTKLSNPEPHRFLGEAFPRDMEPKITAVHEIDHDVARTSQWEVSRSARA